MTTIKSYTDLEQSRKLAKILPLESADMVYQSVEDEYGDGEWESIPRNNSLNIGYDDDIPCWSLAALLGYLSSNFHMDIRYLDNYWELDCRVQFSYDKELVDACYEMILKLHELKLL